MTYLVLFLRSYSIVTHIIAYRLRVSLVITTKNTPSKGCGNILIPAAAEFARIGYFKMETFANILNLQFLKKSNYYKHRGDFIYPEINRAWEKNQEEQFEEIWESGRTLSLAVAGQHDSPGHNTRYNTVTALDIKANKVLDFMIVHVKVRCISLLLLQPDILSWDSMYAISNNLRRFAV